MHSSYFYCTDVIHLYYILFYLGKTLCAYTHTGDSSILPDKITIVNSINTKVILTGILTGLVLSSNGICLNTQFSVKVNNFSFANIGLLKL